jgi:uncharacterized membrane-anchored protein YitT (DUF2179 family)
MSTPNEVQPKTYHSIREDILALTMASLFVSLGIYFFKYCGFLTGGTAGVALMLQHIVSLSFGQLFFLVNLPFYYLAWTRMGKRFTLNTFASVTIVSFCTDNLHYVFELQNLNPYFAAIAGGLLIGMGILIMFRHVSSLGGLGVLSKYVQDRFGLNAGKFQMSVDVCIVALGFFLVPFYLLLLSIVGAISMNVVVAFGHKPGRYHIG